MIVEVAMLMGIHVYELMEMDMYSINSLAQSVYRIKYTDKFEDAYTAMLAAQGTSKDMKNWTERWKAALGRTFKSTKKDAQEFIKRFGKGF